MGLLVHYQNTIIPSFEGFGTHVGLYNDLLCLPITKSLMYPHRQVWYRFIDSGGMKALIVYYFLELNQDCY
ncbi:hypothetical protein RB195_017834 [Necator americanus]|uniref:Uncharacterized protein n=1 Tax=Necator americanus TaxID=51031 RepID=A0ABR1C9A0_NECAM